jgi:hypothetical protein
VTGNVFLFTWNIKWNALCDAGEFCIAFNKMVNATGPVGDDNCQRATQGRYLSLEYNQN